MYAIRSYYDRGGARRVLRSSSGLDEDRATRGAALGRTFDVLELKPRAIAEGAAAAHADPANPEAHRFLSETFRGRKNTKIVQSSEQLKADLFV